MSLFAKAQVSRARPAASGHCPGGHHTRERWWSLPEEAQEAVVCVLARMIATGVVDEAARRWPVTLTSELASKVTAVAPGPGRVRVRAPVDAHPGARAHREPGTPVRAGLPGADARLAASPGGHRRRATSAARAPTRRPGRASRTWWPTSGLGKVGIILGIEVSRLARNNADWYQLLDLCALTDTLIADGDGLYHPADFNDRLVLGLKGTMSEAELHLIRHRLTAGLLHKAAKGELRQGLPVGFVYDEADRGGADPDEAVVEAIATVFRRFEELGLGPPGDAVAARTTTCSFPAGPPGRAGSAGPSQLSGDPRLLDQPRLRRGVRLRPHPGREAPRRRRPAQ